MKKETTRPTPGRHILGRILVASGTLVVADPSYYEGDSHMFTYIRNCITGTWMAGTQVSDFDEWGCRVRALATWLPSLERRNLRERLLRFNMPSADHPLLGDPVHLWEQAGIAGVDSGQMSIVDQSALDSWDSSESDDFAPEDHEGAFSYLGACNAILYRESGGGVLDGLMAVSSTGMGDGAYPVYVGLDENGNSVAVRIDFLEDA